MSKFKNAVRVGLGALLATSIALTAVGCGDKGYNPEVNDPEKRPLVLSTNKPDEVFNPFFATSAVDSDLVALTQIGLLSADKKGNIVCGENEPSVALDYSVREVSGQTIYQFVIKNGIKYSDGVDLTIDDVLFNLYVYLDYAYTGSATMYSTKIVGLNEYRTNDPNATDASAAAWDEKFQADADLHVKNLINYVKHYGHTLGEIPAAPSGYEQEEAEKDFERVCETFRKELSDDYNSILGSMETYEKNYKYTAAWQPFLAQEVGYDFYLRERENGPLVKDENKNPQYDPDSANAQDCASRLAAYIEEHKNDEGYNYDDAVKEWAVQDAFKSYIGETIEDTYGADFEVVLTYFDTANKIRDYFKTVAANEQFSGNRIVNSISGITATTANEFVASSQSNATSYTADYQMLQIKVNGVDPKAIYNFSFIVAPRHYYGDDTYPGVNEFGVAPGDADFMEKVVKATEKNATPVGAGSYMATNSNGDDLYVYDKSTGTGTIAKRGFISDNIVYYKRNENFHTVGAGLDNAKIKLLRYQVINSDQIISSLNSGEIDFGEPSATLTNEKALKKNIKGETAWTNGYGYVGINARFVPNINVRRAIIKAMDTSIIVNDYYQGGYADIIYRSMSNQNWAYPEGVKTYTAGEASVLNANETKETYNALRESAGIQNNVSYAYDSTAQDIKKLLDKVLENGYYKNSDGLYTNGRDTLDYTFTIAGGNTDHPAYKMFNKAAEILNQCEGIHVKVETSQQALSDLNMGKLTVWAAAWISAIDPDMYQVYHKDSKASSVKNWGYDYIMNDQTTYKYEWQIVQDLSKKIDQARRTTNQKAREDYYAEALDLVMELAVELPTYQRKDLFAYNRNIINPKTLQPSKELSPTNGPLARIWEVNYYLEV